MQFRKGMEVIAGGRLRIVCSHKQGDSQVWCRLPESDGRLQSAFPAHQVQLVEHSVEPVVSAGEVVTCLNGMRVHVASSPV